MKKLLLTFCIFSLSNLTQGQDMVFDWVTTSTTTSQAHGISIAKTSDGGVISVGDYRGSSDFDPGPGTSLHTSNGNFDSYVLRLDSNGHFMWDYVFGGSDFTNLRDDQAMFAATDQNDDVYVAGRFFGTVDFDNGPGTHILTSNGHIDGFLLKLSSEGEFMWVVPIGGSSFDQATSIQVLNDNSVLVIGTFAGVVDFDPSDDEALFDTGGTLEGYLANYGSDGSFNWIHANEGSGTVSLYRINQYDNGNIVACGTYSGQVDLDFGSGTLLRDKPFGSNALVFCLDLSGNLIWAREFTTILGTALVSDIDLGANQRLYGCGWFSDDISIGGVQYGVFGLGSHFDVFYFQLSPDGEVNWSHHGGTEFDDGVNSVAAHPDHGAVFSTYSNDLDFTFQDNAADDPEFVAEGGEFLVYFGEDGSYIWKQEFESLIFAQEVVINPQGLLYFNGFYQDGQDFDPSENDTETPCIAGTVDTFTARYHIAVGGTTDGVNEKFRSDVSVYPNPTNNQLHISINKNIPSKGEVRIFNPAGQKVAQQPYLSDLVNVESLLPGLYFMTISFENGTGYQTKFVKE